MKSQSILLCLFLLHCPHGLAASENAGCVGNPEIQKKQSNRLQELVNADQADRESSPIDWNAVAPRDLARRIEVAKIFAAGCLQGAGDYSAAALVFQHGDSPDHFFQTFLWAKKAMELGDGNQQHLMIAGIDRYLVNSGRKQLFGSQYFKLNSDPCWCLDPLEKSFPEKKRARYGSPLRKSLENVKAMNKNQPACERVTFCKKELLDSPKGTIPGFW